MANILMNVLYLLPFMPKRKPKKKAAPAEPVKHYTFMLRAGGLITHVSIVALDRIAAEQKMMLDYPNAIIRFLWEYIRTTPAERAAAKNY